MPGSPRRVVFPSEQERDEAEKLTVVVQKPSQNSVNASMFLSRHFSVFKCAFSFSKPHLFPNDQQCAREFLRPISHPARNLLRGKPISAFNLFRVQHKRSFGFATIDP